jgi:hypothetical protein
MGWPQRIRMLTVGSLFLPNRVTTSHLFAVTKSRLASNFSSIEITTIDVENRLHYTWKQVAFDENSRFQRPCERDPCHGPNFSRFVGRSHEPLRALLDDIELFLQLFSFLQARYR